jgi:ABC-2 type transport system permease protein
VVLVRFAVCDVQQGSRGAIKPVLSGISLTVIGSLLAGMGVIFHPVAAVLLLLLIIATSIAFNGMLFLMTVRVEDPLVLRAIFGVLNTLLFFPQQRNLSRLRFSQVAARHCRRGSLYLAVHGLKSILHKDGGFDAIRMDLLFLFTFGFATLLIATPLFKRSL